MVTVIVGAGFAAHAAHGFVQREADDALAVDGGEVVAGLDAGARGRRAVDRGDDAHDAVFAGDFDAEAAIFAAASGPACRDIRSASM